MAHTPNCTRLNVEEATALVMLIKWAEQHGHEELARGALLDPFSPYTTALDKLKPMVRAERHQGSGTFSIEEESNG